MTIASLPGIQSDVIATLVPVANRLAQARDALRLRIAVRIAATSRFYQFIDYVLRGRLIRVAHAEIDDILTGGPCLLLEVTNNIKDVWRQSLDTPKFIIHGC